MNSNEKMIKYKHDIIGQFRDINMAISSLEASDFEGAKKLEVFQAVHEVLLKMVKTSSATIDSLDSIQEKEPTVIQRIHAFLI